MSTRLLILLMKKRFIIPILIFIFLLLWFFDIPHRQQIYLFQNNFQGAVLILNDGKHRKEIPRQWFSSIYVIPPSGILATGTKLDGIWYEPEKNCYYIDTIENAENYILNNTWKNHIVKKLGNEIDFGMMIGGIYGNSSNINSIRYFTFNIHSKYSKENIYTKEYITHFNKTAQLITGDSTYKPLK